MIEKKQRTQVKRRKESFVERTETRIWHEKPSNENPYIAEDCSCHGYDILELAKKRSFVDVIYLIFRGELPSKENANVLEHLMIALINPGPRHPATRAAMNAGVGKTDPAHILPIGLTIMGGEYNAAGEVEPAMRFLRENRNKSVEIVAEEILKKTCDKDINLTPGFGSHFGSMEIMPQKFVNQLLQLSGDHTTLKWGNDFVKKMSENNTGWLTTGLAAAVFTDLGFQPRLSTGLYQLLSAPGLLAHGMELANKPITAMPFISDENYVIED